MPLRLCAYKRVNQQHCNRFFSRNEMTYAALYKSVRHKTAHGVTASLFTTLFLSISNCSFFVSSATEKLADNLSSAILQQNDPETAKYGAPAYLIMIDGLIIDDPTNENLLLSGAKLYASYASTFVDDPVRAKRLTNKAWGFAQRAMCLKIPPSCKIHWQTHDKYNAFLLPITKENTDVPSGLAVVSLAACAFFTVLTGASGVTIIALGALLYPALKQAGYTQRFSLGLLTSSGSLGLLFPPSIALILYGIVAQQMNVGTTVSIDDLFIAGLLPGLLMLVLLSAWCIWENRHTKFQKEKFSCYRNDINSLFRVYKKAQYISFT